MNSCALPRPWLIPLLCLTSAAWGQGQKLNAPLARGIGGDVTRCLVSPDSSFVVYCADQALDEQFELFRVPIAGGASTRLNPPLPADRDAGQFEGFAISPDSSRVVFLADQDSDDVFELYGVPGTGGTVTKLSAPLVADGDVQYLRISPDSSRVVYQADQDTNGVNELYSVPLAGGAVTKLNPPTAGGVQPGFFQISPDSSRVVYLGDQDVVGQVELYSVPLAGGACTKLNAPLPANGDVSVAWPGNCQISADSSRVVYLAHTSGSDVHELFSVPLAGGAGTQLNAPLVANGAVDFLDGIRLSADSSRVVYRADQDVDGVYELYSVPLAGGAVTKLNGPLPPGGGVERGPDQFEISPDASRVVYRADQLTNDVLELFSVPLAGGATTRLNGPLAATGDLQRFSISPDSSRALYLAEQDASARTELYSVPLAGGATTKLNGPLVGSGNVQSCLVSADSSRVLYLADQASDEVVELYGVPLAGGSAVRLSGPMTLGGDVLPFVPMQPQFSGDSSRVVYGADQRLDEVQELFSVAASGGGATPLNPTLAFGAVAGDVTQVALDADGKRALYVADQDVDDVFELYGMAPLESTPFKLNGPLVAGGDVQSFRASPSGQRVVYLADQDVDEAFELFSTNGAAPVKLSGALVVGGDVLADYAISTEGRVVYRAEQDFLGRTELYSARIDGVGAPVKLNPPLIGLRDVERFLLSPDGERVVFLADPSANLVWQLFSVPVGGGTPIELNAPLAPGETIIGPIVISPDSARVFYLEYTGSGFGGLHAVSITGGAPVQLSPALPLSTVIEFEAVSADSNHVLFVASSGGTRELFTVPAAGGTALSLGTGIQGAPQLGADGARVVCRVGASPALLSQPLDGSALAVTLSARASAFQISPDSGSVAYFADTDNDFLLELWTVPIAGGSSTRLCELRGLRDLVLAPDSRHALFHGEPRGAGIVELLEVPLDGGLVRRLNGALVANGDVVLEAPQLGGGLALYRADQDENEVFELYLSFLARPHRVR